MMRKIPFHAKKVVTSRSCMYQFFILGKWFHSFDTNTWYLYYSTILARIIFLVSSSFQLSPKYGMDDLKKGFWLPHRSWGSRNFAGYLHLVKLRNVFVISVRYWYSLYRIVHSFYWFSNSVWTISYYEILFSVTFFNFGHLLPPDGCVILPFLRLYHVENAIVNSSL